jgi:DNA-binding NtrC family response regulator
LLTEVDQLSSASQAELARVLGGKSASVRILATARRGLIEMAERGEFRPDLAMLLSPLVISLLPLSQRRSDVPLLLQFFVEHINAQGERQRTGFTSEAIDLLESYSWPGNVDELIQLVRESHERSENPSIGTADLPRRIHMAGSAVAHPRRKDEPVPLEKFLAEIEQELIRRAMKRAKGNKAKAARLLGMTRPRLYRRLVQLGFTSPDGTDAAEQ